MSGFLYRSKMIFAGILAVSQLSGCATTDQGKIQTAIAPASGIIDTVICWTKAEPTVQSKVSYANSCEFDMLLRTAMKNAATPVTVDVQGAFKAVAIPDRLGNWFGKITSTGGQVLNCSVNDGEKGMLALIELLWEAGKAFSQYKTYQFANTYSAAVVIQPDGNVREVLFLSRLAPVACPDGTTFMTKPPA